jgi:hypothetical protein
MTKVDVSRNYPTKVFVVFTDECCFDDQAYLEEEEAKARMKALNLSQKTIVWKMQELELW